MAEASVQRSMSDHAESSSAAAVLSRNEDPMTLALRAEHGFDDININDLVRLNRTASPSHDIPSSLGTLTTTVFSSREQSSGTKPTSAGTSYPIPGCNGKGKAVATYASSLSATHGSSSEVEAVQDQTLFGVGDWTADGPIANSPLKGAARARKKARLNRRPRHKKPVVIIQRGSPEHASSGDDEGPTAEQVSRRNSKESKYFRQRRTNKPTHNPAGDPQIEFVEDGLGSQAVEIAPRQGLSRARLYVLSGLVVAIAATFALSTFAAHYTGQRRMACTKGIIFSATVLISCFTVLAMVTARRALQEALLAGLLELFVGFTLLVEIHDFMAHGF